MLLRLKHHFSISLVKGLLGQALVLMVQAGQTSIVQQRREDLAVPKGYAMPFKVRRDGLPPPIIH